MSDEKLKGVELGYVGFDIGGCSDNEIDCYTKS